MRIAQFVRIAQKKIVNLSFSAVLTISSIILQGFVYISFSRAFPHACGTRAHACVHTLFEHSLHTCTRAHHVCTTNISVKDQIDIAQIYVVDDDGTCSTYSCKIIHKFVCVLYNFKYNSLLCWLRLHYSARTKDSMLLCCC